jgi:hypothetical protein
MKEGMKYSSICGIKTIFEWCPMLQMWGWNFKFLRKCTFLTTVIINWNGRDFSSSLHAWFAQQVRALRCREAVSALANEFYGESEQAWVTVKLSKLEFLKGSI